MGEPETMSIERPLVTMNVKGFNQEETIGDAVRAALAQTYSPLEIILSDDASEDRTFAIMKRLAASYRGPHKVVLNRNKKNLGIVGNMNRVASLASGRLLIEASGDDISEPFRVERTVAVWEAGRGRVKAVHSRFTEIDYQGRVLGAAGPEPVIVNSPGPDPLTIVRSGANCIGATAAWDLELFERFGPVPAHCQVEDGVLFFRAALLGKIAFVEDPLIRYRTGGVSRRRPRSPGYDYLYGDRIKFARWRLHNAHAFLADLERVDFARKAECKAILHEIVDKLGFEIGLADRNAVARLVALPGSAMRSVAQREQYYFVQAFKHALGLAYVAYFNARSIKPGADGKRRRAEPVTAA